MEQQVARFVKDNGARLAVQREALLRADGGDESESIAAGIDGGRLVAGKAEQHGAVCGVAHVR